MFKIDGILAFLVKWFYWILDAVAIVSVPLWVIDIARETIVYIGAVWLVVKLVKLYRQDKEQISRLFKRAARFFRREKSA